MKKYNTTIILDGYKEELFVCELTTDDVISAEKEFSLYMQKLGKTYDMDTNKYPSAKNFFKLYFGDNEPDIYGDHWVIPNRYICTDENIIDRFMKLVKRLEYHDTYNQTFCIINQNGKYIDVSYGDY